MLSNDTYGSCQSYKFGIGEEKMIVDILDVWHVQC